MRRVRLYRSAGCRPGFTLLEVILALAVLAVALAIVGEANVSADRNARRAALESDATLIAESVLDELAAGGRDFVAVDSAPWDDGRDAATWSYTIAIDATPYQDLLATRVSVQETQAVGATPVRVSLVRWMVDPQVEAAAIAAGEASAGGVQ